MRDRLGDGYTETLRQVYPDVPETVDFVMYWWHKAAELVRANTVSRFGFITTNSIHQVWQRRVIDLHLNQQNPLRLLFAIPDHPWTDEGAAVRIAMTGASLDHPSIKVIAQIGIVISEERGETPEDSAEHVSMLWKNVSQIFANLHSGSNVSNAIKLQSNDLIASRGVCLHGAGFLLNTKEMQAWGKDYLGGVIKAYRNGRDLVATSRNLFVIDFFGLSELQASQYVKPFQKVLEEVKPERDVNKRKIRKDNWWLFGETMPKTRESIADLKQYGATPETAKHRVFQFLDNSVLPDNKLIVIALEDPYFLGILSSKIHVTWALAAGSRLEDRPVYAKTTCFDTFPFPNPDRQQEIRELGERLDSHRKRVQSQHPEVTITAMYNLLEKLRAGEPLTDKDREFNNKALVSTLKQIHDELDAAVFEAYGWEDLISPSPLTPLPEGEGDKNVDRLPSPLGRRVGDEGINEIILERLVALNAERAEEERNGLIRWLRPDYQAPGETQTQQTIEGLAEVETESAIAPVEQQKLPKAFKDQLAAVRDLLRTQGGEWTIDQIAAQFKSASRQKQTLLTCLESLEALGIIARHEETGSDRWYLAELQKAS
jgi:hypothetical protein